MEIKLELSKNPEDQFLFTMSCNRLQQLITLYSYKNYNKSMFRDKRYKRLNDTMRAEIVSSSYAINSVLLADINLYANNNYIGSAMCYSDGFLDKLLDYYNTINS